MKTNNKTIKIIQLTDTHLSKDDSLVFNVNTNLTFKKIMLNMQFDLKDADAIFLTGDLSQDETIESYQIIVDAFKPINKRIFWIPGNHDSVNNMKLVFGKETNFFNTTTLSMPLWDFIFLNTKQDGTDKGFLSDEELILLNSELKKDRSKPIALIMHHHPMEVKTPLIDNYILENKDIFLKTIEQFKVNLIICGHVHHDYSLKYGNINIETSPASSFQFKKGSNELIVENIIGYKVYYFTSNNYVAEAKFYKN